MFRFQGDLSLSVHIVSNHIYKSDLEPNISGRPWVMLYSWWPSPWLLSTGSAVVFWEELLTSYGCYTLLPLSLEVCCWCHYIHYHFSVLLIDGFMLSCKNGEKERKEMQQMLIVQTVCEAPYCWYSLKPILM